MKLLIAAWGSAGEHLPVAELAREMADGSAVVHVLANAPFRAAFGPRIASFTPLRFSPDGRDFHEVYRFKGRTRTAAIWRDLVDPLVDEQFAVADRAIAGHAFDLVLAGQVVPGVAAAAEHRRVPFVPLFLSPLALLDPADPPAFVDWERLTSTAGSDACAHQVATAIARHFRARFSSLVSLRARLGLTDDGSRMAPGFGRPGLLLFPSMLLNSPTPHVAVRRRMPAPANPPPAIRDFLAAGDRPWLVCFGSFLAPPAETALAEIVQWLRAGGDRVIVAWGLTGKPALRAEDGVLHLWSPRLANIYGHVKSVVHHGGINLSLETLAAGLPSLVLPQIYDQLDNARRLARLGVAAFVPPSLQSRPERVRAALERLNADSTCGSAAAKHAAGLPTDGLPASEAIARVLREYH